MEEDARRSIHPASSYIYLEGNPCIQGECLWSPSSYLLRRVLESLGQGSLYYGPFPLEPFEFPDQLRREDPRDELRAKL